ncbi:MAG: GTP-binding protein [Icmadophila ericetorum]|nr:GTP-binding protein [Icmadophila ericetorum]
MIQGRGFRLWSSRTVARAFIPINDYRNVSSAQATVQIAPSHGIQPTRFDEVEVKRTPNPPKVKYVPKSLIAHYWDTTPPTKSQLKNADRFFLAHKPSLLFSSEKFRTVEMDTSNPEVAFLGRSNVGKSSLLNALLGAKICHTSNKPGRTRSMNFFAVGGEDGFGSPGKLTVLDMPGYGHGSRAEWGPEIYKYLVGRRQLRRAFLLIDTLHGLKRSDETMLRMFRENAVPHQVLLSKVDTVFGSKHNTGGVIERKFAIKANMVEERVRGLREIIQPKHNDGAGALGEIIAFSTVNLLCSGKNVGISQIRWAILAATGLGQKLNKSDIQDVTNFTVKDTHFEEDEQNQDLDFR